jgi:hypothetical protein
MKTICLDLDDYSILNNRLDLLIKLKEHFPNLKVTAFTIPYDYQSEGNIGGRIMRATTLKAVQKELDWIRIVPHGLLHLDREFEKCTYETMMENVIPAIDEAFKKDGLPYVKGFKAPQWLWNEEVIRALDEVGWWGAIDRNQPQMLKTKTFFRYSHSIDEPFWESDRELLKLHGHIAGPEKNNLERCFFGLMKMPSDAKFVYADELLQSGDGKEDYNYPPTGRFMDA